MSLLTSVNDANTANAAFIHNAGTDAAPVLGGTTVDLCIGSNVPRALTSAGDAILRASNPTGNLTLGAGASNTLMELDSTGAMFMNANPIAVSAGAGQQLQIRTGAVLAVQSGGSLSVEAGANMTFNNASAPRGTFRASLAPVIGGAGVYPLANPPGIVEGLYAITVGAAAGGNQNDQISACAYWNGATWEGGAAIGPGAPDATLTPVLNKTSLQIQTSGAVPGAIVRFTLLAGAA